MNNTTTIPVIDETIYEGLDFYEIFEKDNIFVPSLYPITENMKREDQKLFSMLFYDYK